MIYYGYHGTKKKFESFRTPEKVSPRNYMQFGIHFSASEGVAAYYSGKKLPAIYAALTMNNPLDARDVITKSDPRYSIISYVMQNQKRGITRLRQIHKMGENHGGHHWLQLFLGEADRLVAEGAMREGGYDGAIYDINMLPSWGNKSDDGTCYVVLHPSQIKVIHKEDRLIKALTIIAAGRKTWKQEHSS